MAAVKSNSDLIVCSICFETFKCPKSLPCLHSFCKQCLSTFLTSASATKRCTTDVEKFSCPVCRLEFTTGQNAGTVEDWVETLPTNHLLVSMIDIANMDAKTKVCELCKIQSKTESATSWCTKCGHGNKNKIVSIADIEQSNCQINDISCLYHLDKTVEAYCFDHNKPCCVSCVMIDHRKCDKVENANNAANRFRQSDIFEEMKKDFEELLEEINALSKVREENTDCFKNNVLEIKNEVVKLRQGINAHLDKLENDINQEILAAEKEYLPNFDFVLNNLKGQRARIKNSLATLSACRQYASDEQLLVDTSQLQMLRSNLKKSVKESRTNMKLSEITFDPHPELLRLQSIVKSFGKVEIKNKAHSLPESLLYLRTITPLLKVKFESNTPSFITGCSVVDKDRIVLSTWNGKNIEMYNMRGNRLSSLACDSFVWDVDMLDDKTGVATVYTKNVIVFTVNNNLLQKQTTIQFPGIGYSGVCHMNSRVYIGLKNAIDVRDLSGNQIQVLRLQGVGWVRHITPVNDHQRLCFTNGSEVLCITLNGQQVFKYSSPELNETEGIGADNAGNIYVIGRSFSDIHQLTSDGTFLRVLLRDLNGGDIYSLHYSMDLGRLVFSTGKTVHVYDMIKQ